MITDFSPDNLAKITKWAKIAKHDKLYFNNFSFTQSMYDCFWNIPEAVDEGFNKYFQRKKDEYNEILLYHNKNCLTTCIICRDRIKIKQLLGIDYERK